LKICTSTGKKDEDTSDEEEEKKEGHYNLRKSSFAIEG
jgi:hypothetical protein